MSSLDQGGDLNLFSFPEFEDGNCRGVKVPPSDAGVGRLSKLPAAAAVGSALVSVLAVAPATWRRGAGDRI